jgi:hypothetical protein
MKPWRERLIAAEKRGYLTMAERRDLRDFQTCLVGEQHARHPDLVRYRRLPTGVIVPVDRVLRVLGEEACNLTSEREPTLVALYLDRIEDRVLELKRQRVA